MTALKTLKEHREYLHQIVRLKLCFLHRWLHQHPEESFADVLRKRVDIYRKTDLNPGLLNPRELFFDTPAWLELEMAAEGCFHQFHNQEEKFETAAFELFRPSIDRRCKRDFLDRSALAPYQCGCFRYDPTVNQERSALGFHIANDRAPESFLDAPEHVEKCLRQLADVAEREFHCEQLYTSSWLNSLPRFLAFFPPEWQDGRTPENRDVAWHYSYWGQFITARGTFNRRYGEYFRQTGKFPFYPRIASCRITALRQHLAERA